VDNVQDFFKQDKFDEVPAIDPGTMQDYDGYESIDSDDIAETKFLQKRCSERRKETR
jgi:hypothetical protein